MSWLLRSRLAGHLGAGDKARSLGSLGYAVSVSQALPRRELLLFTAALAWAAAFIHATVISEHFNECWAFGAFFVVVACSQFLWGIWAYRSPRRRVLLGGALGNVAVAALWTISRTSGLPFGPDRWHAEAVGAADVLATLDELAIAVLVVMILNLRGAVSLTPTRVRLASSLIGALLFASLLGPMLGANHHVQ